MDFVFANTYRMNKNFVLVIILLCSTTFLTAQTTDMASSRGYVTVIKQEPGELIYEVSIPTPDIDSVIGDNRALHSVALKHAESHLQADGYAVPSLNYLIELPVQANPTIRATAMNKKILHGIRLSSARDDWSADSQADPTAGLRSSRKSSTSALASIRYHGKMRDIPLYELNITPIQYHAQHHTLEITTRMQVVVRYNANTRTPVQEINNGEIDALLSDRLINAESARRARQLQTNASSTAIKLSKSSFSSAATAAITGGPYIRMTVDKEGIYKISVRELQALSGVNLQSVDPRTLRLIGQGLEERVYVRSKKTDRLAADDIIEFYGEPYRAKHNKYLRDIPSKQGHYLDPWATDNVYFLIWGSSAGLRLIEEEGSLQERDPLSVIKPASYTTTKHFEEDNVLYDVKDINLIRPVAEEDIWVYDNGISYSAAVGSSTTSREYEFELPGVPTGTIQQFSLRINLQAISTQKHFVNVELNNNLITPNPITWTDATKLQQDIPFSSDLLSPTGTNTLRISTTNSTERNSDIFAMNWFEITYKRNYSAVDNMLIFTPDVTISGTTLHEFTLSGFNDLNISIYKRGSSRIVNPVIRNTSIQGKTTYQALFQDDVPISGIEYIAVGETAKLTPKTVTAYNPGNLQTGNHDARYLIITSRALRDSALRLENYRKGQGYSAETITIEDIYDEFSYGAPGPYAIRDFLRYVYSAANWKGSQGNPLYVCLIGDASRQPKTSSNEIVPTQFIQTQKYGAASSDYWFCLADDQDIIPDFFIGRIPVINATQLNAYIDKIIAYEKGPSGNWKNKIVFIGGSEEQRATLGNPEIPRDVFRYQSTLLINNRLAQRFTPERIYAYPGQEYGGGAGAVTDFFSDGALIITYLGHGGGGVWGDRDIAGEPMMNHDRINLITPNGGRYPIVLSMTCFVGAFDSDGQFALGETMMLSRDRGAAAVLAASGTGWIIGDYQMLDNMMNEFLAQNTTAGQSIAKGKTNYLIFRGEQDFSAEGANRSSTTFQSLVPQSMVYQFNFLGDPALKVRAPRARTMTLSNYSPSRSASFNVSGATDFSNGSGTAEIFQTKPTTDSVSGGANKSSFANVVSIPFTITNGQYDFSINLNSIPNSALRSGLTGIRLYGESSDGQKYFNSNTDFYIDGTFIADMKTIPATPTSSDIIRFSATVSDPQGVARVIAHYTVTGPIASSGVDTLKLTSGNTYESQGIGPFAENDKITYVLTIYDTNGDSTQSPSPNFKILSGIDLNIPTPLTKSIYVGGSSEVRINAVVQNLGFAKAENVNVRFYEGNPLSTGVLIGETFVQVEGSITNSGVISSDTASILSSLSNGEHVIAVWVDPDSGINDVNRSNNLRFQTIRLGAFNVTPSLGTTFNGTKNDTVSVDSALRISIPPGVYTQNGTMSLHVTGEYTIVNQPDISPAIPYGASAAQVYEPGFSRLIADGQPIHLIMRYDTLRYNATYTDSLSVYRWDSGNRKWTILSASQTKSHGQISAILTSNEDRAPWMLMINRDRTAPVIETTIEGQLFTQGGIAPRQPRVSAIVYDRNGVSLNRNHYAITVDNAPISASQIVLPDSVPNSNTVTFTLNLNQAFDDGQHEVLFTAKDVNGNTSKTDTLNFQVIRKFDIESYGNYPNPFINTTTFAFRVEAPEPLEALDISIYTVSGRRIRKITDTDAIASGKNITAVGYHEVTWDALDEDGRPIANGVYFYRIRGKLNGKTIEKKGKLAYFR